MEMFDNSNGCSTIFQLSMFQWTKYSSWTHHWIVVHVVTFKGGTSTFDWWIPSLTQGSKKLCSPIPKNPIWPKSQGILHIKMFPTSLPGYSRYVSPIEGNCIGLYSFQVLSMVTYHDLVMLWRLHLVPLQTQIRLKRSFRFLDSLSCSKWTLSTTYCHIQPQEKRIYWSTGLEPSKHGSGHNIIYSFARIYMDVGKNIGSLETLSIKGRFSM